MPKALELAMPCMCEIVYCTISYIISCAGFMLDAPAAQLQHLFEALEAEQAEDPIPYQALFLQDSELSQVGPLFTPPLAHPDFAHYCQTLPAQLQ